MNGFSDLQATLQGMGFRQLLPAFGACTAYAMAQGRIVGPAARRWAWGAVVVCAAVFSALCRPWAHGVVLVAFGLAGMGLFTGLAWLISRLIGFRNGTPAPRRLGLASAQRSGEHGVPHAPEPRP